MQRVWSWAGKFDISNYLIVAAIVAVLVALVTGEQPNRKPAPVPIPDGDKTLVIPTGVIEDSKDPNGYWVDSSEDGSVMIEHSGDTPVKLQICYWRNQECIAICSVMPLIDGSGVTVVPRLWYCDGIYLRIIRLK